MTDSGTGMDEETLAQAFEPFFTTKEVGQGSGLGLSMVYGFVKQSGGSVTVASQPGKGTTVKLYLPRCGAAKEEASAAETAAMPDAAGETILVVEDDADVRALAVAMLSSLGYRILEAADGKAALEILRSQPAPDLLFTDVVLPGKMSGPQLAADAVVLCPDISVLYTSGYTQLAQGASSGLEEAGELLHKPYRKADLAHRVRSVLDTAKAQTT